MIINTDHISRMDVVKPYGVCKGPFIQAVTKNSKCDFSDKECINCKYFVYTQPYNKLIITMLNGKSLQFIRDDISGINTLQMALSMTKSKFVEVDE